MNETTKISGVAGIVFGVLVVLAFLVLGDSPAFVAEPEEIHQFFLDNEGKILAAAVVAMLAGFALAWFGNGLRDAHGRGAATAAPGAGIIAIGAAMAASAYAISGAVLAVGAQRVSERGDAGAASAFLNYDLFQVIYGAAAPIGLSVLLTGVAVSALRGGSFIPTWLAWVSIVLAVVGLIPPISWALTFGIALWSIGVGILMLMRPASDRAVTQV